MYAIVCHRPWGRIRAFGPALHAGDLVPLMQAFTCPFEHTIEAVDDTDTPPVRIGSSAREAERRAAVAEREDAPPDDLGEQARAVEQAEARKAVDWNARVIRLRRQRPRTRVWVSIRGGARAAAWTAYLWHCPACGKGSWGEQRPYTRAGAILGAHTHSLHCIVLFRLRVAEAFDALDRALVQRALEVAPPARDPAVLDELQGARLDVRAAREKLGLLQDPR